MNKTMLRMILVVPAILLILVASVSTTTAAAKLLACHNTNFPRCLGRFEVAGASLSFQMAGSPSLALVEEFSDPKASRSVLWDHIDMKGTTELGEPISATLDKNRQSTGTVLSLGDREFPAKATMKFFFRIETGGATMVSASPAVFEGIVHSVPPAPGDSLTLVSGPVEFHQEGDPTTRIGALQESTVVFNAPNGPSTPGEPGR